MSLRVKMLVFENATLNNKNKTGMNQASKDILSPHIRLTDADNGWVELEKWQFPLKETFALKQHCGLLMLGLTYQEKLTKWTFI